jgi:hypothetical protein
MSSPGDILEGFPHPTITPVIGIPTYESIADLNLKLNANAASVHSNLGDGAHGLLALTIDPAVYNTISPIPFVPPANPGINPLIPALSTNAIITELTRQHATSLKTWQEYQSTDKALKQQLLAAIDSIYYRSLRNRITGYANVATLTILRHLYDTYGNISPTDLIDNDTRMKAPYDPSQPIELLFDQFEDAIELAAAANAAYTGPQIVAYAYNTVLQTGLFTDACRDWRRRPAIEKTWPNFKTDFAQAHQEIRESQVTSQGAGFHSANAALAAELQEQTFEALANLATATASDRSAVSNLTGTNSALTIQLATTNAKLDTALADIAALRIELSACRAHNRPPRNVNGDGNWGIHGNRNGISRQNNNNNRSPTVRKYYNENYCWTHGWHIHQDHTSQTCRAPKDGHKTCATRTNTMNGSQRHKELVT